MFPQGRDRSPWLQSIPRGPPSRTFTHRWPPTLVSLNTRDVSRLSMPSCTGPLCKALIYISTVQELLCVPDATF